MPLTAKGETLKKALQKEYGAKKGLSVLYAGKNKGTFTGIDVMLDAVADAVSTLSDRMDALAAKRADASSSVGEAFLSLAHHVAGEKASKEFSKGRKADADWPAQAALKHFASPTHQGLVGKGYSWAGRDEGGVHQYEHTNPLRGTDQIAINPNGSWSRNATSLTGRKRSATGKTWPALEQHLDATAADVLDAVADACTAMDARLDACCDRQIARADAAIKLTPAQEESKHKALTAYKGQMERLKGTPKGERGLSHGVATELLKKWSGEAKKGEARHLQNF